MKKIYESLLMALEDKKAVALAAIVKKTGSAPRGEDALMLVYADGGIVGTVGGGAIEGMVIADAVQAIKDKAFIQKSYELTAESAASIGMICGGDVVVDIDYIEASEENIKRFKKVYDELKQTQLVIFGAGHIGAIVTDYALNLEFDVTVVDDRVEFANEQVIDRRARIIHAPEYDMDPDFMGVFNNAYVVIVTRGHLHDRKVLQMALSYNCQYIGMIGSKKKIAATYEALKSDGVSADQLEAVHAPIGLAIGAKTPGEIAISIMAQLIQERSNEPS